MRQVSGLGKYVCKNACKLASKFSLEETQLLGGSGVLRRTFPRSALVIITSQCQQLAAYLSALLGIFPVQCRKTLRILLPELLIDMRSEKHALLIILHPCPFSLVTRPEKRGFHTKVLRYLLNECRHFLRH